MSTTTLKSYDSHPKQRSQFLSPIDSDLSAPAAPESLYASHMMSSFNKYRVTVSGTSLYSKKAAHMGFSKGGTHMSGCFSKTISATGRLVFIQISPRRRDPPLPPHGWWLDVPPDPDFLTARYCGSCVQDNTNPLLCVYQHGLPQPYPPPTHPTPGQHRYLSPSGIGGG